MSNNSSEHVKNNQYWQENLRIIGALLIVWFVVSFGCGILLVDVLNHIRIGGYKLGFWFAQQGSIYTFVVLIFFYTFLMSRLDKKYSSNDDTCEPDEPSASPPIPSSAIPSSAIQSKTSESKSDSVDNSHGSETSEG